MSKLVKKQTHMLQSGDVIYFVYRKSEPEQSELLILLCHDNNVLDDFIRRKDNIFSCHLVDIAYVYHSIKTEQTVSQHSYGK